jgi:phage terminase small subunit
MTARRRRGGLPAAIEINLRAPKSFSENEKRVWREQLEFLQAAGTAAPSDLGTFALLCQVVARRDENERQITADGGRTYRTETGYLRNHPLVSEVRADNRLELSLRERLGLAPLPRLRAAAQSDALEKSKQARLPLPEPVQPRPSPLGKKDAAQQAAMAAGTGSDWGDDLRVPHSLPN